MTGQDLSRPLGIDISGWRYKADPFPVISAMQAAGPVIPMKVPLVGPVWMATTHAANMALVKDPQTFVQEARHAGKKTMAGAQWWMPRSLLLLADNMLMKDEPDHRRLRTLVDQAFHRRGVLDMRDRIKVLAERLLQDMSGEDTVDLVHAYARRLPLDVICELLGVPDADRAAFAEWTRRSMSVMSALGVMRMMGALGGMTQYIRGQIAACRQAPRPGLIGELVQAEADGDRLNEDELVSMVFLLLVAGFETTTHLISGAIAALEQNPEQKAVLLADPEARIERAIEECLRHVTPVQNSKPRYVAKDTEFFGRTLRRGDVIMAFFGGANADRAVFDRPEELKLDRFPNPHMSFSSGIHFCLGLQLARVEAQIAIAELYAHYPNLHVLPPRPKDYVARIGVRGFNRLNVRLAG